MLCVEHMTTSTILKKDEVHVTYLQKHPASKQVSKQASNMKAASGALRVDDGCITSRKATSPTLTRSCLSQRKEK